LLFCCCITRAVTSHNILLSQSARVPLDSH
jgi:hypothetical protein